MRKLIALILFTCLCSIGNSQIIKGAVLDRYSQKSINSALVYFNGTSVGVYTDQYGSFWLDISDNLSRPLTISALGYYSLTISDLKTNKLYKIYLTPKTYELNGIFVTSKGNPKERKTNLHTFKREFLGTTMNAKKCEITNEKDITLTNIQRDTLIAFVSKSIPVRVDTLKAFSSNPIIINNKSLGYKIIYYLDKFEYSQMDKYLLIRGNCIFREDSTNINRLPIRYEKRRKNAYLGSRTHFLRALWNNELDEAGFTVWDSENLILTYDRMVSQSDSIMGSDTLKYFIYRGKMFIAYSSKIPKTSVMIEKERVYFNKERVLDPLGISWYGEMADKRIGDLLPSDYKIK